MNVCGVAAAMLQGHSWAPTPSNGSTVNVGTTATIPSPISSLLFGGKVRRRPMSSRWGGGPVIVRGRESRSQDPCLCGSHGEGVQRVCGINAFVGVRW